MNLRYGELLALLLALALAVAGTIVSSNQPETNLKDLLQDMIDGGLIEATLKDFFIAPRSVGQVILFEDMHRTSLIWQRTARSMVNLKDLIDFIALEGASTSESLDYSLYSNLRKINEVKGFLPNLAWGWLVNNCIPPAEYYALALEKESILRPVEDASAYEEHKKCLLKERSAKKCEDKRSKRDEAMAQNILGILGEVGQDTGVLVIGAAHVTSGSITEELKERNISYYVLSPRGIDQCMKNPWSCGFTAEEYFGVCQYVARNKTPLSELFRWLSGSLPPKPNKAFAASPEFQRHVPRQVSLLLALHYLWQRGMTVDKVRARLAKDSKIAGVDLPFPEELKGVVVSPAFTRTLRSADGLKVEEERYVLIEGEVKKALVKFPKAIETRDGILPLGEEVTWDKSIEGKVNDLLTLPENGLARADLFSAVKTPGSLLIWQWQLGDGTSAYGYLTKRTIKLLSEKEYFLVEKGQYIAPSEDRIQELINGNPPSPEGYSLLKVPRTWLPFLIKSLPAGVKPVYITPSSLTSDFSWKLENAKPISPGELAFVVSAAREGTIPDFQNALSKLKAAISEGDPFVLIRFAQDAAKDLKKLRDLITEAKGKNVIVDVTGVTEPKPIFEIIRQAGRSTILSLGEIPTRQIEIDGWSVLEAQDYMKIPGDGEVTSDMVKKEALGKGKTLIGSLGCASLLTLFPEAFVESGEGTSLSLGLTQRIEQKEFMDALREIIKDPDFSKLIGVEKLLEKLTNHFKDKGFVPVAFDFDYMG